MNLHFEREIDTHRGWGGGQKWEGVHEIKLRVFIHSKLWVWGRETGIWGQNGYKNYFVSGADCTRSQRGIHWNHDFLHDEIFVWVWDGNFQERKVDSWCVVREEQAFVRAWGMVERQQRWRFLFWGKAWNTLMKMNQNSRFEISYDVLQKNFHKWWTLALAKKLKDGYSNNLPESIHARLQRFCPKGYSMSTVDWCNRVYLTTILHNEGWPVLVRTWFVSERWSDGCLSSNYCACWVLILNICERLDFFWRVVKFNECSREHFRSQCPERSLSTNRRCDVTLTRRRKLKNAWRSNLVQVKKPLRFSRNCGKFRFIEVQRTWWGSVVT